MGTRRRPAKIIWLAPLYRRTSMPTRKAEAVWNGNFKEGNCTFKGQTGLNGGYTRGSRFEEESGSNPEELLAAAHASCYSMALALALDKNGTSPSSVKTE